MKVTALSRRQFGIHPHLAEGMISLGQTQTLCNQSVDVSPPGTEVYRNLCEQTQVISCTFFI